MYQSRIATTFVLSAFLSLGIVTVAHAQLQSTAPIVPAGFTGGSTGPDALSKTADKQCPKPDNTHKYDKTKGKYWLENNVTITNLHGKVCRDVRNDVEVVEGKCVAEDKCEGTECYGTTCKKPETNTGSTEPTTTNLQLTPPLGQCVNRSDERSLIRINQRQEGSHG